MTEPVSVRVVDAQIPRSADRALVQVAVGVLIRSDDSFLLTSRPEGKAYAGFWEFPGGKLEAGETVAQALKRELQEEIGITMEGGADRLPACLGAVELLQGEALVRRVTNA
jgi:8-oxo-dGTP diphosphatase